MIRLQGMACLRVNVVLMRLSPQSPRKVQTKVASSGLAQTIRKLNVGSSSGKMIPTSAVVVLVGIVSNAISLVIGPATVRIMKVGDRHTGVRVVVEVAREGEGEVNDRTNQYDCCTSSSIHNH